MEVSVIVRWCGDSAIKDQGEATFSGHALPC